MTFAVPPAPHYAGDVAGDDPGPAIHQDKDRIRTSATTKPAALTIRTDARASSICFQRNRQQESSPTPEHTKAGAWTALPQGSVGQVLFRVALGGALWSGAGSALLLCAAAPHPPPIGLWSAAFRRDAMCPPYWAGAHMARGEQLIRQHRILRLLAESRQGLSLDQLCSDLIQQLGLTTLSTRTVRRDIEALQAAGYAVESRGSGDGVVWQMLVAKSMPPANVTSYDLLAVSLAQELLRPLAGSLVAQAMDGLWARLSTACSESAMRQYDRQRQAYEDHFAEPGHSPAAMRGVVATLSRGILQHRVAQVEFRGDCEISVQTLTVQPYRLLLTGSGIYLSAGHHGGASEDAMFLNLAHIVRARLLDVRFVPRPTDAPSHDAATNGPKIFKKSPGRDQRCHTPSP